MLEIDDNMGITVYTTTPDEKCAEEIAKQVVEAKLAACCNFWPVRTVYSWKGEMKDDTTDQEDKSISKEPKTDVFKLPEVSPDGKIPLYK